jgi:hypothetical protein
MPMKIRMLRLTLIASAAALGAAFAALFLRPSR